MTKTVTDARTTRLIVSRRKEGDDPGALRYDTFDVAVGPRATILDALVTVRREQDPSLTFRHSCFHASCGTCGMRVNGTEGLACVTPVPAGGEVTVEPLGNLPVVSDLVVNMDVFYDDFDDAGRPLVRSSEKIPGAERAEGIDELERYEDCIECGICLSACPVAGSDPRYVGPAALAAAWRVVEEPRGLDPGPVVRLMDDEQAAWRCHLAWECSEACPSGVDPAVAIMRLRRSAVGARARTPLLLRREPLMASTTAGRGRPATGPTRRRGIAGWFDPRGRRLGGLAFILNRVSGIGLVVYLYLHLVVLSLLAQGPGAWDTFVNIALSPPFLALNVILLAGMLIHGLNGIRVGLVGLGFVASRQRALFIALMVIAAFVAIVGALRIFGGE